MNYFLTLLIVTFLSGLSFGQEIGVSYSKLWSGNYEIENPGGVAIYISQSILGIGVKVQYENHRNEREYFGHVVFGFMPNPNDMGDEQVLSNSSIQSIDLSLSAPPIKIKNAALRLGLGIGHNVLSGKREGTRTGRKHDLFESTNPGIFAEATLIFAKIKPLPVNFYVTGKVKNILSFQSVVDIEAPFSQEFITTSLQFGMAYRFGP